MPGASGLDLSRRLVYNKAMTIRTPLATVDIIIRVPAGIVLIRRRNKPPGWALPGGFIDRGESAEDAARREAREETGLRITRLRQFHVYSAPGRDPRFATLSVVFTARARGVPRGRDDAREARVFKRRALPRKMAFDHRAILNDYFRRGGRPW